MIPADLLGPTGAIQPNTPQYRAMSITVADNLAAAGNIQAGDVVDVLYTLQFAPEKYLRQVNAQVNAVDATSRIVFERVPILYKLTTTYVIRTDAAAIKSAATASNVGG